MGSRKSVRLRQIPAEGGGEYLFESGRPPKSVAVWYDYDRDVAQVATGHAVALRGVGPMDNVELARCNEGLEDAPAAVRYAALPAESATTLDYTMHLPHDPNGVSETAGVAAAEAVARHLFAVAALTNPQA